MRTRTRVAIAVVAGAVLIGWLLGTRPLLAPTPVDAEPFGPVPGRYAASVGKVLSTTCYGAPIAGSGFVVDPHLILTAAHVVDGARQVSVRFAGSPPILADVIGIDPARDTALLRTATDLGAPLALAEDGTEPGTAVVTLGYPLGDAALHTELTRITATTDTAIVNDRSMGGLVTLDVTLHPGSSGGPAVDAGGRVRGMVVASIGGRGGRDSVSTVTIAVPSATLASGLAAGERNAPIPPKKCDGELAPGASGPPVLAGDAGDAELAHTLWLLGTSTNHGQWGSAWGMLTEEFHLRLGNQDAWTVANERTRWTLLELREATRSDEEHATAAVRLRTSGAAGCREQVVDYALRFVGQAWLIDGVTAGAASACD